jgi:hypothetical protein
MILQISLMQQSARHDVSICSKAWLLRHEPLSPASTGRAGCCYSCYGCLHGAGYVLCWWLPQLVASTALGCRRDRIVQCMHAITCCRCHVDVCGCEHGSPELVVTLVPPIQQNSKTCHFKPKCKHAAMHTGGSCVSPSPGVRNDDKFTGDEQRLASFAKQEGRWSVFLQLPAPMQTPTTVLASPKREHNPASAILTSLS